MNEVQINKIKKRADEYATSCFPYEKQFLEREAVVKCCVHVVTETVAELEGKISILLSCKNCPENKGGFICQKEYEDKCLAQKIQYIKELQEENKVLTQNLEDTEIVNKALEKENAELKSRDCWKGCLYASGKSELILEYLQQRYNLTKAKELLKKWVELSKPKLEGYPIPPIQEQTEQFLNSEVEK